MGAGARLSAHVGVSQMLKILKRLPLRHLLRDRKGLAGIEFAIAAPVIVILIVGATDIGMLVYNRMDTTSSIQAGAQYFMAGGADTNQALATVKRSWTSMPPNTELSIVKTCYCAEVVNLCTVNCADGSLPVAYNIVSARLTYTGVLLENEYVISEAVRVR
jgi:Flp pilus assembly protein TadG